MHPVMASTTTKNKRCITHENDDRLIVVCNLHYVSYAQHMPRTLKGTKQNMLLNWADLIM